VHPTNPRLNLRSCDLTMLKLWRLYRGGGGLAGAIPGHLPEAGGTLDQAAIMLHAFDLMSAAEAALREGE